jgi:hypothetical protein
MAVEINTAARRMFFQSISWPAIFAALAVGIAVQLFLILVGFALGVSVVGSNETSASQLTTGATAWSAVSMIIAALIGGYVAARCSGLRRKGDGMLHGAVAWGASTLLFAVLASTALGTMSAGLFGAMRPIFASAIPESARTVIASNSTTPMRDTLTQALRRAGLSEDQINSTVDQVAAIGGDQSASPAARQQAAQTAEQMGMATGWLCLAVLLSLIAGVLGGLGGVAPQRRMNNAAVRVDVGGVDPRIMSRTAL